MSEIAKAIANRQSEIDRLQAEIPPHRAVALDREERYFADGLRELPDNRRLAILAVCAVEWEDGRPGRAPGGRCSRSCSIATTARPRPSTPTSRRAGSRSRRRALVQSEAESYCSFCWAARRAR